MENAKPKFWTGVAINITATLIAQGMTATTPLIINLAVAEYHKQAERIEQLR